VIGFVGYYKGYAENIDRTIINLRKSSKGLNENMNAAKENFLLKGYFIRKEKAAQKNKDEALKRKAAEEMKTRDTKKIKTK